MKMQIHNHDGSGIETVELSVNFQCSSHPRFDLVPCCEHLKHQMKDMNKKNGVHVGSGFTATVQQNEPEEKQSPEIQLLEALQDFVQNVGWHVNKTSESGFENPQLDESQSTLDSVLHALIVSEKAKAEALERNL